MYFGLILIKVLGILDVLQVVSCRIGQDYYQQMIHIYIGWGFVHHG